MIRVVSIYCRGVVYCAVDIIRLYTVDRRSIFCEVTRHVFMSISLHLSKPICEREIRKNFKTELPDKQIKYLFKFPVRLSGKKIIKNR